jgi:hypothetical protein
MQAYAHASFLCPGYFQFSKRLIDQKSGSPPSHENSNNLLAVEPETENDAGPQVALTNFFKAQLRLKRRLKR